MAKVEFNKVSKRFDKDTIALQHLSLTIEDGEFMVLVGPSGCGKSTALRLLAGLETVSEGEILIDDKVVNQITPQQRNVAMVFQNYALYPHMTVRGNLQFPLKMAHTPVQLIVDKVTNIARILDLSDLLERKPKQLSGGQRQRVAMGRALVRDPNVFLLDEPLSNLDASLRAQIRADISVIQKRLNKTSLYVTHDQVEAMTLGDRVAVMNGGELQQVGTPEELYEHPQNIFVAKFIGSPGMNIIPSALVSEAANNVAVRLNKQTINLSHVELQARQKLLPYSGQTIFLGIRPEAFHISPVKNSISVTIKILSTEFLGHETLVYFQLPATDDKPANNVLIARISGKYLPARDTENEFYVHAGAIYLFNKQGRIIDK